MRATYTRSLGDSYETIEAETTQDRESEVHLANLLSTLSRRIIQGDPETAVVPDPELMKTEEFKPE